MFSGTKGGSGVIEDVEVINIDVCLCIEHTFIVWIAK